MSRDKLHRLKRSTFWKENSYEWIAEAKNKTIESGTSKQQFAQVFDSLLPRTKPFSTMKITFMKSKINCKIRSASI